MHTTLNWILLNSKKHINKNKLSGKLKELVASHS